MFRMFELAPRVRLATKFMVVVFFLPFMGMGSASAQVSFEEIVAGQQCDGRFPVLASSFQSKLDSMVESPFPDGESAIEEAQSFVSAVAFAQAVCNHKNTVSIIERCIEALENRKFVPECITGISLGAIFDPDNPGPEAPMVFANFGSHLPCFAPPFDRDGRPCQQIFLDAGGAELSAQAVADFARSRFEEFKTQRAEYFVAAYGTLCTEFDIC